MILTPEDLARCRQIRLPGDAIMEIVEEVAEACALAPQQILSKSRTPANSAARDLVCFIASRQQFSQPQIARVLGCDPSTVWSAISRERVRRQGK